MKKYKTGFRDVEGGLENYNTFNRSRRGKLKG